MPGCGSAGSAGAPPGSGVGTTGGSTRAAPALAVTGAGWEAGGLLGPQEYDHLVPLELAGSSDTRNLWPEPDQGSPGQFDARDPYGRNAKDGVEDRLAAAVCAGRVPLAAAQEAVARDWTTAESTLGIGP